MRNDQKNEDVDQKALWKIINPIKIYTHTAIIGSAIGGICKTISIVLLAYLLSILAGEKLDINGFSLSFNQGFILMLTLTLFSFVIHYCSYNISHIGAFKLEQILRAQLTDHLAKVPLGYIVSAGTGALKKVLLDDVKNLHTFTADSIPIIGKNMAAPIASFIALLIIDYRFAIVCSLVLLTGVTVMTFVLRENKSQWVKYEKSQSDINKVLIEFVQAMPVVRTFDDGTSSFKRYNSALERYRDHLKIWTNTAGVSGKIALTIFSPLPTLIAMVIAGVIFVANDSLDFVTFIAALMISTGMADSLMPLMMMNTFLKISRGAATRILEVMALPELKTAAAFKTPTQFDIAFEGVSFKYNEDSNTVLKNISFTVPQNTATALVGPSGAGKSTVAKLIPRFWDVTQGSIKIGGIDIREIESKTLMETVTFVFQDTFLFNDTLANNIRMAREQVTDEEVQEAAKAAQIHDFIMSLPDGYATMAGDRGTRLSGGQKQRITIARAILRNTPIVVLDEATAFADPENEEKIIEGLSNLTKNKTVIVIAHRLSTIKDVSQILVFDNGKITESGRHNALLKNKTTYQRLWASFENAQNWDLHRAGELS